MPSKIREEEARKNLKTLFEIFPVKAEAARVLGVEYNNVVRWQRWLNGQSFGVKPSTSSVMLIKKILEFLALEVKAHD